MINEDFNSLLDLINTFPNEQACIDHLELLRWKDGIVSPFDESSKVYDCAGNKYRCKNTKKYFNVKTNTIFDNTKLPLQKWFLAIWLVTSHKKGISSLQLSRDIDVTQKSAWFMLQRIRKCFGLDNNKEMEGTIEVDETFVGGKNKNRHADKKVKYSQGRSFKDKTPVMGILQEQETVKVIRRHKVIPTKTVEETIITKPSIVKGHVVPDTKMKSLQPLIREKVKENSTVVSDEWHAYRGLNDKYDHRIIDHRAKEYVNENGDTTNAIEGFWSILKRGIIGVYHYVSPKHLQKYVDEFAFRYNTMHKSEPKRFNLLLANAEHRTKYKDLIATTDQ